MKVTNYLLLSLKPEIRDLTIPTQRSPVHNSVYLKLLMTYSTIIQKYFKFGKHSVETETCKSTEASEFS